MFRSYRLLFVAFALAGMPLAALAGPGAPDDLHPRRPGPHALYGTIVGIHGSRLVVKRRNGRLQSVDATQAIADNNYSMPLFVGKFVAIDGSYAGGGFSAAHIYRLTSLDALGNDR